MKDKICLFCKYHGHINFGPHSGTIFQEKNEVKLNLCYYHSLDLFKSGQRAFMAKYHNVFEGYEILEEAQPRRGGLFSF